jgi:hypothetical protein
MNSACGTGDAHHLGHHLPGGEIAPALVVLGFETHRGPHVGGHQIGPARRVHRIGELFEDARCHAGRPAPAPPRSPAASTHALEIEHLGGLQPGIADVVRIADPGHRLALDRTAMLDEGEDVGQIWQG